MRTFSVFWSFSIYIPHPFRKNKKPSANSQKVQYKHKVNVLPPLLTHPSPCFIIPPRSATLKEHSAGCSGISAHGDVLELADRHDLGSCAARREGSSPSVPTVQSIISKEGIPF